MIESAKVLNFIVVILGSGYKYFHFAISPCIGYFDDLFVSHNLLSRLYTSFGKAIPQFCKLLYLFFLYLLLCLLRDMSLLCVQ